MNDEIVYFEGPLTVGDKLNELELPVYVDGKDEKLNLKNLFDEGKWVVLFFYPADFTFVCPTELEELAEKYDELKGMGVEVISVSTDTVFVHKAWHDSSPAIGKVKFPMGSDTTGEVAMLFGVYDDESGLARRGTFIFSPDGVLKALEINDDSVGRSADELVRKLQALQFVANSDGKVCPASWKPGDDTLEPGMDLVGKI